MRSKGSGSRLSLSAFIRQPDLRLIVGYWVSVLLRERIPYPRGKDSYVQPPLDLTVSVLHSMKSTRFSVGGGDSWSRKNMVMSLIDVLGQEAAKSGAKLTYLGGDGFTVSSTKYSLDRVNKSLAALIAPEGYTGVTPKIGRVYFRSDK